MIYLDNAASSMIHPILFDNMEFILKSYANPSSTHRMGLDNRKLIEETREMVASFIGASASEIYFFSSATEANNTALFGYLRANAKQGDNIIVSSYEHGSIKNCIPEIEKIGIEVRVISPKKGQRIDNNDVIELIDDNTKLIVIMAINNEFGQIWDSSTLNTDVPIFSDSVQLFGKYKFSVKSKGLSIATASFHKIGAFKGLGMLYVKKDLRLDPIIFGGGQEKSLRPGTENLQAIISLNIVLKDVIENLDKYIVHVKELKSTLIELIDVKYIEDSYSDYILNLYTENIPSEVFKNQLSASGVMVSNGSACSSRSKLKNNYRYTSIDDKYLNNVIRVSFSPFNTVGEVREAASIINKSYEFLKSIVEA